MERKKMNIKAYVVSTALLLLGTSVMAADYSPVIVDKNDFDQLRTWAMEQPTKFGGPLVQWLDAQEKKAQDKAAKDAEAAQPKKK